MADVLGATCGASRQTAPAAEHDRTISRISRFVMRWRTALGVAFAVAAFGAMAAILWSGLGLVDMARWAATQQRAFHTMMGQLLSIEGGGLLAAASLIGACLVYGFLHAAVPGHGKFLIAGAGLASPITAQRLVGLSLAASFAQALTAIALVYGSFSLLDITVGWAMSATQRILIPLSYVAILVVGMVLVRRALKGFGAVTAGKRGTPATHAACGHHHHDHAHQCCNHRHGPTVDEAAAITSWRDAAILIASIGLRPCTGAVFVLVAAWRMDFLAVGAAAAVAMALGTGAFISLVAVSATTARGATLFAAGAKHAGIAVPSLQLLAGGAIVLLSAMFLAGSVFSA